MFHTRTLNPKSLLLKIVLSLLSASCHNKFPLQGYNVSGSSTPFSEISQSLGYLWMPTYSLELEEKNTFFTYVLFLQFWRDWIFVRFWELILVICILLWLFLIPFLEKNINVQNPKREARLNVHFCLFDKLQFTHTIRYRVCNLSLIISLGYTY